LGLHTPHKLGNHRNVRKTHHYGFNKNISLCTTPGGRNCVSRAPNTLRGSAKRTSGSPGAGREGGRGSGERKAGRVVHAWHDMTCTDVRNILCSTRQKSERKSEWGVCALHSAHTPHVRTLIVPNRMAKTKESLKLSTRVCQPHGRHTPPMPAKCPNRMAQKKGGGEGHGELVQTKEKTNPQANPQFQGRETEWMAPKEKKLPGVIRTRAQQTLNFWDSFPKRLQMKSPNGRGGGHQIRRTASPA
jgi:hypothetical protein